jgi:hypothetical protein
MNITPDNQEEILKQNNEEETGDYKPNYPQIITFILLLIIAYFALKLIK